MNCRVGYNQVVLEWLTWSWNIDSGLGMIEGVAG